MCCVLCVCVRVSDVGDRKGERGSKQENTQEVDERQWVRRATCIYNHQGSGPLVPKRVRDQLATLYGLRKKFMAATLSYFL